MFYYSQNICERLHVSLFLLSSFNHQHSYQIVKGRTLNFGRTISSQNITNVAVSVLIRKETSTNADLESGQDVVFMLFSGLCFMIRGKLFP